MGEGPPICAPLVKTSCVPLGQLQLPLFCTRHVLTKIAPDCMRVPSGTVTSVIKAALGWQGRAKAVSVAGAVAVTIVGTVVAVGGTMATVVAFGVSLPTGDGMAGGIKPTVGSVGVTLTLPRLAGALRH